jgi:uncharacterized protein YcbX
MNARLHALRLYPVKACCGIEVAEGVLRETGLEFEGVGDREWVVVDSNGHFLSQRTHPRMALIQARICGGLLRLTAPEMPLIEIRPVMHGPACLVRVQRDDVEALDQGELAGDWLSEYLELPCRLMRFHPQARRLSDPVRTDAVVAPYRFADAFALLIVSLASLADLNRRLAERSAPTVGIERFRPNLVLDGIAPYEEDYLREVRIGPARIQATGRCTRCSVPGVDPATGVATTQVPDLLAGYRRTPDGVAFGMNAIATAGIGTRLAAGQDIEVEFAL